MTIPLSREVRDRTANFLLLVALAATVGLIVWLYQEQRKHTDAEKLGTCLVQVFEASDTGIIQVNDDAEITWWSPACERLTGWLKEEMLGKKLSIVIANPEASPDHDDRITECLKGGLLDSHKSLEVEGALRTRSGAALPVKVKVYRRGDTGLAIINKKDTVVLLRSPVPATSKVVDTGS